MPKTLTLIFILLIIIPVAVISYFLGRGAGQVQKKPAENTANVNKVETVKPQRAENPLSGAFTVTGSYPVNIGGTIKSANQNSITLQSGDGEITFNISSGTSIYKMEVPKQPKFNNKAAPVRKNLLISEVKAGQLASVTLLLSGKELIVDSVVILSQ